MTQSSTTPHDAEGANEVFESPMYSPEARLAEIKDVPVSKVLQEESDWPEVVDVVTVRDNRGAGKKFMVHVDGKFTIFTMPTAEPVDSLEAARVRMEQWAQHIRTGNLRDDLPNDSKGDVDKERKGFARQVKRKLKL